MNDEEKNLVIDTLKTPGWTLIEKVIDANVENLRRMATQDPDAVTDARRTFDSGKAQALEELKYQLLDLIKNSIIE